MWQQKKIYSMLLYVIDRHDYLPTSVLVGYLISSIQQVDVRIEEILMLHQQKLIRYDDVRDRINRLKETKKCLKESLLTVKPELTKDVFQR